MEQKIIILISKEQKNKIKKVAESKGLSLAPFCRMVLMENIKK